MKMNKNELKKSKVEFVVSFFKVEFSCLRNVGISVERLLWVENVSILSIDVLSL